MERTLIQIIIVIGIMLFLGIAMVAINLRKRTEPKKEDTFKKTEEKWK